MISEALAVTHSTPIGTLFTHEKKVDTFESDTPLQEVLNHFITYASDTVIIIEKALLIGILTLKDMIRALHSKDNLLRPVKDFMVSPLYTYHSTMSIADVIDAMSHVCYDKIVVTHHKSGILGVIDRRHLLSLCYNQLTPLIKHEYNMIHSMMGLVKEGEKGLLKMATTDTLTGIGNRRMLEEVFQAHQKLGERYGFSVFLLMFDIDNFKSINDTFGHNVGDSVLQELALLVEKSIRKSDLFVRWGGEEFVILLRYSDPMTVMKIADQIRKRIDKNSFETIVHVTCSFGLTAVLPDETLETVFKRADKALYRAKADGKNVVRMEQP